MVYADSERVAAGRARRERERAAALNRAFEAAGGCAYVEGFAPAPAAEALRAAAATLVPKLKQEVGSYAKGRIGTRLQGPPLERALVALASPEAEARVSALVGEKVAAEDARIFPVDLRVYRSGASMGWHQDELLYDRPQYELVYTLWNTTDSRTLWRPPGATGKGVEGAATRPNSAPVLRAGDGGADHCVTEATRGERAIVKVVFRPDGAARSANFYGCADQQTSGNKAALSAKQLEAMVEAVIANNAAQVQQYLEADEGKRKKLVGFFVGQVMKLSKGQANPKMVNELLAKKLV